jgi:hypothetical protein
VKNKRLKMLGARKDAIQHNPVAYAAKLIWHGAPASLLLVSRKHIT